MTLITASSRPAHRSTAQQQPVVGNASRAICRAASAPGFPLRGFSLIDLLVSLAVMAVLIALLLPSLAMAREATNRIRCASNMKQLGAALVMYASDNADLYPYSVFGDPSKGEAEPQNTLFVHLQGYANVPGRTFDGLGLLADYGYIDRPENFYCPSHSGNHTFEPYASNWATRSGLISSNYQFRLLPGRQYTSQLDPWTALIADGMRTPLDYNHEDGHNMLTNDMAVRFVGIDTLPDPLVSNFSNNAGDSVTMAALIFASWAAMDSIGGGRNVDDAPFP